MNSKKYNCRFVGLDPNTLYQADPSVVIPDLMDYRDNCSPIENQDTLGACTGHGIAGIMEWLENKTGWTENKEGNKFFRISRLFVYYNERKMEGTIDQDAGASIADGISSGQTIGYANECLWPYVESNFTVEPPQEAYHDAMNHRIASTQGIATVDDMINCLATGFPFVVGISVYDSFESETVAQTGVVPMPDTSTENLLGGHCIGVFGFDKLKQVFICRNSWGPNWGDKGYFYLPYQYLAQLSSDAHKVTK